MVLTDPHRTLCWIARNVVKHSLQSRLCGVVIEEIQEILVKVTSKFVIKPLACQSGAL